MDLPIQVYILTKSTLRALVMVSSSSTGALTVVAPSIMGCKWVPWANDTVNLVFGGGQVLAQ